MAYSYGQRRSTSGLYPDMAVLEGAARARAVFDSYKLNRASHSATDEIKAKCVQYVHGYHFTASELRSRTADGLPTVVADETHGIWATLDGWARSNRSTVQFMGLGDDDPKAAECYNRLYSAIRTATGLQSREAEVYGMAVIMDEAFLHVYPVRNGLGELEPASEVLGLNQCYPDPNCLDPIDLTDAQFVDLPRYMSPGQILRVFKTGLSESMRARLTSLANNSSSATVSRDLGISADAAKARNGQLEVVFRYYMAPKTTRFLIERSSGSRRQMREDETDLVTPEVADAMGFDIEAEEDLILYRCVLVPEASEVELLADAPWDFQPYDPVKGRMTWPVRRLPHKMVARKPMGAVRGILSLQDSRNLIISSLQHHLQTAANGGMIYEADAFTDPEEERKFKEDRNHGAVSVKAMPGAIKDKKIAPIERGNVAFNDFGDLLNNVILDVMRKITGAEPVMRGQAQQGAAASLQKQQIEQAQNQMMNSSDLYQEFQFAIADLIMSFVRQHYTDYRVIMVDGAQGNEKLELNKQTYLGVLNDVSQGLYTVRKTSSPATASARRQRLADDLEIAQTLLNLQAPAFLVDWEGIIDALDKPQEVRDRLKQEFRIWKASQGIGALPGAGQAGYPAQASMPQPQGQPAPAPAMPVTA